MLQLPKVLQVLGRRGSTEATQNQVMVCVVTYVPDQHVLEKTKVFYQDLVNPGLQLLHVSGPQPLPVPWK